VCPHGALLVKCDPAAGGVLFIAGIIQLFYRSVKIPRQSDGKHALD
jgi:hypothetical protein